MLTHRRRPLQARWKTPLSIALAVAIVAGVVLLGVDYAHHAPTVRMQSGTAWLTSNKVGQLTLVDGASAEVVTRVPVAPPDTPLQAAPHGASVYALNRTAGSVTHIDGATRERSRPVTPMPQAGDQLTLYPAPHALLAVDAQRGLLAQMDTTTLVPQHTPYPLATQIAPNATVVDHKGTVWALEQRRADLVWFAAGSHHVRHRAGTPRTSHLTLTHGRPALLDTTRHVAELLDTTTGAVHQSIPVDLSPQDTVAVNGSPDKRRILISVSSRGLLMVCTFDGAPCTPVPLGTHKADLGAAIEINNHAVVPDYTTSRAWIVDLATMRIVAQPQLFAQPTRFDLQVQDGIIFYNDPNSEHAGVLDLNGRIRPITKYNRTNPDKNNTQVNNTKPVLPTAPNTAAPSDPVDRVPSQSGPGGTRPKPGPATGPPEFGSPAVAITVQPRDHGLVGEEFGFTVTPLGPNGITAANWTFGDGTTATGTTVRHRWDRPGSFPVNVAATLTTGQAAPVATVPITIDRPDAPPRIIRLDIQPEKPRVGQPVQFSADVAGRSPDTWTWTVTNDQGTETTSTTPTFRHTFNTAGKYTVTLAITAGTASAHKSETIIVMPPPHKARCGDTLTTDAILTQDLTCPDRTALTIVASNVTLDLNGHTITATTLSKDNTGIMVSARDKIANTIIRAGTIAGFFTGISISNATGTTINGLAITNTSDEFFPHPEGVIGYRASDTRIQRVVSGLDSPLKFNLDSSVEITDSNFLPHPSGEGSIVCTGNSKCIFRNSDITDQDINCWSIDNTPASSSIQVQNSNLKDIKRIGWDCAYVALENSEAKALSSVGNGGIVHLIGNSLSSCRPHALFEHLMVEASTFLVKGNTFSSGGICDGYLYIAQRITGTQGMVTGNTFADSLGDGMLILVSHLTSVGPVIISGNRFVSNQRNGLTIGRDDSEEVSIDITVSNNHTENNGGLGIYAFPIGIVVDGGGNTSSGNGGPGGCLGVICRIL